MGCIKKKGLFSRSLIFISLLYGLVACLNIYAQPIPRFRVQEQQSRDFFHKGLLFYHSHRYGAAREFFYKALNVHPYFHLARSYLGDAYYYSGNWGEAIEQWEFLTETSGHAYPLVEQRSQLLRFRLGHTKQPDKYVFVRYYNPNSWINHKFKHPSDLSFSSDGHIHLASYSSANVIHFSPSGVAIGESSGPFYNVLSRPIALTVDSSTASNYKIYVCDYAKDRIQVFSKKGSSQFSFGEAGSGPGQFHGPTGIAIYHPQKFVFVSDAGNRRIQKFDLEGKFLLEIGHNLGNAAPQHPAGLAIDDSQTLYVADRDGGRILLFDFDGNYSGSLASEHIKKPRGLDVHNNRLIIADEEKGIVFYDIKDRLWSKMGEVRDKKDRLIQIRRPFSARVDPSGALYIADYGTNRLLVLSPLGMRISNLNCKIQKIDQTSFPQIALFVTATNRLDQPLIGLTHRSFYLSENDQSIKETRINNIIPYNRRTSIAIVKENSPFFIKNYDRYLDLSLGKTLSSLRISDTVYLIHAGDDARLSYQGLEGMRILRLAQTPQKNSSQIPRLDKGIYEGISYLVKRIGPRALLLIVSGKHYEKAFTTYSIARLHQYARSHSIPIYVLSYEGEQELPKRQQAQDLYQKLAMQTGGKYFHAFNELALGDLYKLINEDKDRRYIISYETKLGKKLSGRYVDIRLEVDYLGTRGIASSGYFIP